MASLAKTCTISPKIRKELKRFKHCLTRKGRIMDTSDCRDRLTKALRKRGLKRVAEGTFRTVYEFNGCVLKVAKYGGDPQRDNMREWLMARALPRKIRNDFLLPSQVDKSGGWITFPRAFVEEIDPDIRHDWVQELDEKLEEKGYSCADLHYRNVGRVGRKKVIVDYGWGVSKIVHSEGGTEYCMLESKPKREKPVVLPPLSVLET